MSEFVEKIIEEKGQEVQKETIEEINRAAERATERFQGIIEHLKEQAKIVLPVNVVDILAKGGIVEVVEVNVPYKQRVNLEIGHMDILHETHKYGLEIEPAKYCVLLIMEKIGPAEKTDC